VIRVLAILAALWFALGLAGSARAVDHAPLERLEPTTLTMNCAQDLHDGRIVVTNGDMIPKAATFPDGEIFHILNYQPTSKDGAWTKGPCQISVMSR
jgi:hypothetical protein